MTAIPGTRGQSYRDFTFDNSGAIATGGTAQLILPERLSTSMLTIQNISAENLYFEFGSARATAAITSGAVSSITVTNAGFGFTRAPKVTFIGGGNATNGVYVGATPPLPFGPSPSRPATGTAVLSGGVVASITINDPGAGYISAPRILITNDILDPNGCAVPSATSGILLVPNGSLRSDVMAVTTDPIAVYGATTGSRYTVKWMT